MAFMNFQKVKIHISFWLLCFVNLITDNFLLFLVVFSCFIIHELGHIIIIFLKKGTIKKLELNALGAVISTTHENDLLVDFGRHHSEYHPMFING